MFWPVTSETDQTLKLDLEIKVVLIWVHTAEPKLVSRQITQKNQYNLHKLAKAYVNK